MIPYKKSAYKLLHDGSIALAEVEGNGIQIDVAYLKKARIRTKKKIAKLEREMEKGEVAKVWRKVFKSKTNFNSNDQLGKVLFEHMGIESTAKTKTGKYSTNEKALMAVDHPFVEKYLKIKKLQKALTTYLKGIGKEVVNGLLHPFFSLHITRTYRSSSDSPNFQNIPVRDKEMGKLIRKAFIARPGNHLVEIDYSGIEVCVAACYHKDPAMIDYIKHPEKDMHRDMAVECYKLKPEQVTKDIRFYGKNCFVFPQFYGSAYTDCARNLWEAIHTAKLKTKDGIPLKKHLKKQGIKELGACNFEEKPRKGTFERHIHEVERNFWEKRFRVYNNWKKKWYYEYLDKGWMLTKTGFICQGYMKRNEIINYPVQGSAFHCLLWSLIRLIKELKKRKMKTLIVGQIHDSILADVPQNELKAFLILANDVMTKQLPAVWKWINVPLEVEAEVCTVGGSWADKKERKIPKRNTKYESGNHNSIHSILPEYVKGKTDPELKRSIMKNLKWGKENAIKLDKLATICGKEVTREKNPDLRKAIKELLCNHLEPVCACKKGMFLGRNKKEIKDYKENFVKPYYLAHKRSMVACDKIMERMPE